MKLNYPLKESIMICIKPSTFAIQRIYVHSCPWTEQQTPRNNTPQLNKSLDIGYQRKLTRPIAKSHIIHSKSPKERSRKSSNRSWRMQRISTLIQCIFVMIPIHYLPSASLASLVSTSSWYPSTLMSFKPKSSSSSSVRVYSSMVICGSGAGAHRSCT